jgi:hypothetical protein
LTGEQRQRNDIINGQQQLIRHADRPSVFYFFPTAHFLKTILAYQSQEQSKQTEMIIYGGLALLFQPFFKITLGRELWNIVDVVVGIGLILSIFSKPKFKKT